MTIHASAPAAARSVAALRQLVGNTPLLEVLYRFDGRERRLYAKYESLNMTGSVKDRMACHILGEAYASDELQPGDTIVEASSGNTGISFAALGRALGHPVRIYMPDWMSQERVALIRSFGAEVVPVSAAEGGFIGAVQKAVSYAREPLWVFPHSSRPLTHARLNPSSDRPPHSPANPKRHRSTPRRNSTDPGAARVGSAWPACRSRTGTHG